MSSTLVISTMDGRAHSSVINYIKNSLKSDNFDIITTESCPSESIIGSHELFLNSIHLDIQFSLKNNGINTIVVVGLLREGENRKNKIRQINETIEYLQQLYSPIKVTSIIINEQWQVEKLNTPVF